MNHHKNAGLDDWTQGKTVETPYQFPNRPAAKSSTSILVCKPGKIACPTCGCRDPLDPRRPTRAEVKPGCKCICHKDRIEKGDL